MIHVAFLYTIIFGSELNWSLERISEKQKLKYILRHFQNSKMVVRFPFFSCIEFPEVVRNAFISYLVLSETW